MIDKFEANRLALEHVESLPAPANGYRVVLGEMRRVEHGWYYDYSIVCESNISESEQEKFAGAFGFTVNQSTSEILDISYHEWVFLGLSFHNDPYGSEK